MNREIFMTAIQLAAKLGETVTIGGGEPTLHPEFLEYCKIANRELVDVAESLGCSATYVVTNGTRKKVALQLAEMARFGEIGARISIDLTMTLAR